MDFVTEMKKIIPGYEELSGDYILPCKYVDNDPYKSKRYVISECVETEDTRDYNLRVLKKRFKNFTEGVNIMENVQKIDIALMEDAPSNWSYLPVPNDEQLISLMASIENIGLINPIILLSHPNYDKYDIIEGKSRVLALKNLYKRNPLEKYRYPVCFILDSEKVDEYYIRSLILDLNFKYRAIPQDIFIRMILERAELLKRSKQTRGEINIAEVLAKEFLMSKSSIYNYLVLGKLTEEIKTLLFEKRITLQIARTFAKVSHEIQMFILENIDFKDINSFHRIKFIIGDGSVKDLDKIRGFIEKSKNIVPDKISFNVTVNKRLLSKTCETLIDLKKYAAMNYSGIMGDNANRFCKITFDQNIMKYYLEQNLMDEKTVNKLTAKTLREILSK